MQILMVNIDYLNLICNFIFIHCASSDFYVHSLLLFQVLYPLYLNYVKSVKWHGD